MSLDVGAIAKGCAVELTARKMEAQGVDSLLMSIGGNLRSIGRKGDGTPWRAGVQNPDLSAQQQNLAVIDLTDASLVTSGSYQRYYTVDGQQYHHIIDPETSLPGGAPLGRFRMDGGFRAGGRAVHRFVRDVAG
ncbi:MAG: FAD:protein FMN transferase [Lachnospiraceae bacterium]